MLNINGILGDKNISKDELMDNIKICNTVEDDFFDICCILSENMGISYDIAKYQLNTAKLNIENSVKIIDKRNRVIYGILLLCDFSLYKGSPICEINPLISVALKNLTNTNGFLFVIDKRLRGENFDKLLIDYVVKYIKEKDYIWIAVDKKLKSHNYWKRKGFTEIMDVGDGVFYVKILNNTCLLNIYNNIKDYANEKSNNI